MKEELDAILLFVAITCGGVMALVIIKLYETWRGK